MEFYSFFFLLCDSRTSFTPRCSELRMQTCSISGKKITRSDTGKEKGHARHIRFRSLISKNHCSKLIGDMCNQINHWLLSLLYACTSIRLLVGGPRPRALCEGINGQRWRYCYGFSNKVVKPHILLATHGQYEKLSYDIFISKYFYVL